jgi:hypothetical protein
MRRRVSCLPSSDIAFRDAAAAALAGIDGKVRPDEIEQIPCEMLIGRYPGLMSTGRTSWAVR